MLVNLKTELQQQLQLQVQIYSIEKIWESTLLLQ